VQVHLPTSLPKPACTHIRDTVVCKADGNGDGLGALVNGPISINTAATAVKDAISAAADKVTKPVDRSKGLWTRCDKCGVILYIKHLKEHHHICFGCNYHLKMSSQERVDHLIDAGTWRPLDETLSPVDPLEFTDMKAYVDRIKDSQEKTGLQDGVRTGTGLLHGIPVALGVMDFGFMGGSMGSVVGEKLTRLIEYATQEGLPVFIVCTSGGARMQEGILSLMQMAKISAALHVHQNTAGLLYVSILTSPTTGGVTASFGMLGDLIIAEPQAIIGFAGRRVIEQTLQEQLPDDFQTAEYLLEHGLLDLVVPRSFLKGALYEVMEFYQNAPGKRRGSIPFGMQRGAYLTTEERMRRKWAEWAKASSNGSSGTPSYSELVSSFETVCSSSAADMDVKDLVKDESILKEAISMAKSSTVSWVEQQETLINAKASDRQFVFKVAQESH
jgi:acetyl-CoA carboxylase carboxyl transferase subunit beta